MKAILVDSKNQTVTEIEINNYKEIYSHLGEECRTFEAPVSLPNNDTFYVDEEGLYHTCEGGWKMKNFNQPILGNAVIQGTNINTGESIDVKSTVDEIKKMIIWVSKIECRLFADQFN